MPPPCQRIRWKITHRNLNDDTVAAPCATRPPPVFGFSTTRKPARDPTMPITTSAVSWPLMGSVAAPLNGRMLLIFVLLQSFSPFNSLHFHRRARLGA